MDLESRTGEIMIKRTLSEAAQMADAVLYAAEDNPTVMDTLQTLPISGVTTDSRSVKPGMLYVPLQGARADGHSFIEQVKEKKAAASLWQKDHLPYPTGIPLLLTDDPLQALQKLAHAYLLQLDPYTIGITGSNGKTSTKDMVASIFSCVGKTQKTQGNHNNEIGLPLTILDFDEDIEYAVLEMGMENYGEIDFLCSIAPLDLAVIVSIGSAHLENFGSRDGIAKAKMEIVHGLQPGGTLIWNADSPELQKIMETKPLPEEISDISFGVHGSLQRNSAVSYTSNGISFVMNEMPEPIAVHAIGDYQADNALAAIGTALSAGLPWEAIRKGLQEVQLTKMRSVLIPAGKGWILDDTYKSNPESAAAALETLMKIPASRHIAVLADMLDLGENTLQLHADLGKKARELGVGAVYTYGPLSAAVSEAFGGQHFEDKESLTAAVQKLLEGDNVVLIKGSRAMKMDEIVSRLIEEMK